VIKENMEANCGRQLRHERLLNMLENLRGVITHLNDVNSQLGVERSIVKIKDPTGAPMAAPQTEKPVGNLVSVLEILPGLVDAEIDKIHIAIDELRDSLM